MSMNRTSFFGLCLIGLVALSLLPFQPQPAATKGAGDSNDEIERLNNKLKSLENDLSNLKGTTEATERDVSWLSRYSPPVGTVVAFAGRKVPEGWLACDGGPLDPQKHPEHTELAALVGTIYDPAGKAVRLPDLRGRTIIGAGIGPGLSARPLGQIGGAEKHTLTVGEMPSHGHSVTDPGHTHTIAGNVGWADKRYSGGGAAPFGSRGKNPLTTDAGTKTDIAINPTGGGQAHNIMQPFASVNYIIKYKSK